MDTTIIKVLRCSVGEALVLTTPTYKMKGLIVFNEATDISFYSVDSDFHDHLHRRLQILGAVRSHQEETQEETSDLREAISLFFLPLLASFNVLNSLKKPLSSITADDDFMIVFKKFDDQVFVAVNGDGTESEEVLVRKLYVFNRITALLYGPVISRMTPVSLQQRAIEWKKLSSLLSTYERLYDTEQAYLLEAVEHIGFGQLNTPQNVCVSLAEECLNHSLNGGIQNVKHVLLLVGSKILAICGRSPQLPTSDLLLLILLTTNVYCHQSDLLDEDADIVNIDYITDTKDIDQKEDVDDKLGEDHVNGTPYQTPTVSPGLDQPDSKHEALTSSMPIPSTDLDRDEFPPFKTPEEDTLFLQQNSKSLGSRIRQALLGGKRGNQDRTSDFTDGMTFSSELAKFHEQKVFLQLNQGVFIPHVIHCLEIFPQIVLVLVSEPQSSGLAGVICQSLTNIGLAISGNFGKNVTGRAMYDALEDSIKRLVDGSKAEAKALNSDILKQNVVKVTNTWGKLKELHFFRYLEKTLKEELEITRVINQCENLKDNLISLYDELYFSPKVVDYDKQTVVSRIMKLSLKLRLEYGEYLATKATINLPFPGFGLDYPGMVHFAFVDRSFDELTSPSIFDDSVSTPYVTERAKMKGESPGAFLKSKMWQMVHRAQNYLANGYTSQTWMDSDFLYSYCMWISTLNPNLGIPLKMITPSHIKTHVDEPPGVLCGNFYKDIKGGSDGTTPGYVNEIYCIYEPHISLDDATKECKTLAISLWMNTKQSLAPFPLIN